MKGKDTIKRFLLSFLLVAIVLIAGNQARAEDLVNKKKFTHKEWTGEEYTDLEGNKRRAEEVFQINREDASTTIIPYDNEKLAHDSVYEYDLREDSKYFQLLTGKDSLWDLTVLQNQDQAEKFMDDENGFMTDKFVKDEKDGWKEVVLPNSWPSLGFDFSIYTNVQMPWQSKYDKNVNAPKAPTVYNPVGLYRKTFDVDSSFMKDDRRVYISFQGVESCYYVYVNGKEVGYSEDTFSPHKFDITDYLNEDGKSNLLAVKVHKFCDGTWFEDQDMIYDGGIHRDVYLISEPDTRIKDYKLRTRLLDNYKNAQVDLDVEVNNLSKEDKKNLSLEVKILDEEGKNILDKDLKKVFDVSLDKNEKISLSKKVLNPKLWSEETPNIYALILNLYDENGKLLESLSCQLGFREMEFTRTEVDSNYRVTTKEWEPIRINGKHLRLKGVNRHDTDPFHGKAVPKEVMYEDVMTMKRNNINAVRTSHYSNDEYFYWLCNKYGIYMMAETNMESHAIMNKGSIQSRFYKLGLDRTNTTYQRLKNNPAIIMWSIGNEMTYSRDPNEAGGLFRDMIWFFKNNDGSRPVHSEGQNDSLGTDMGSNMYPSVDHIKGVRGKGKIPYVLCEYVHAMGNSVGNIKEYWDVVRSEDNMVGAFIWDFVDQARAVSLDKLGKSFEVKDRLGIVGHAKGNEENWIDDADDASLNGGKSFNAYTIMENDSKFNQNLSGYNKSFTFETIVKPYSTSRNSVLLSKGDYQVALKTQSSGDGLEFFVYEKDNWKGLSVNFPSDWTNNWHQVVGVYDKGNLKIYVDGKLLGQRDVVDRIDPSSSPVGVGYDDIYGRKVDGEISIARIYNKALTKEEIDGQRNIDPRIKDNDPSILLWLDYSDGYKESRVNGWDYYSEDYAHKKFYKEEIKGKFYGYGGDFGELPNDNSFCENGILSPDRNPQPEVDEVKYQYQDFWFTSNVIDLEKKLVHVYNENAFLNINNYDLDWEIIENGLVIESGRIDDFDLDPLTKGEFYIPFKLDKLNDGCEYYLNIYVREKADRPWAKKGHVVSKEQIKLYLDLKQVENVVSKDDVNIKEEDDKYIVSGKDYSFNILKADGSLEDYKYKDEILVKSGAKLNFYRGLLENDKVSFDKNWESALYNLQVKKIEVLEDNVISVDINLPSAKNTKVNIVYTIENHGKLNVNIKVDASKNSMGGFIKVGSDFVLDGGFENVKWYGRGPLEHYQDRATNAKYGIYENTVSAMFYPYLKADESGNLTSTKWMTLENEDLSTKLLVVAKDDVDTNLSHFTKEDLNSAKHPYELTPRNETILGIDYGSLGTGGATCGPGPLGQYQLPSDRPYEWNYTLIPVDRDLSDQGINELFKENHLIEEFNKDEFNQNLANEMIDRIDSFVLYDYIQAEDLTELKDTYDNLSQTIKDLINKDKDRETILNNYMDELEELKYMDTFILDKSKNKMKIPYQNTAKFLREDGIIYMDGHLEVPFNDILSPVLQGKRSFTLEVTVIPKEDIDYNMFLGKGDYAFALRTRPSYIDFHIYAAGAWRSLEIKRSEEIEKDFMNNKHTFTALYDSENNKISVYMNGKKLGEKDVETEQGVEPSDYYFNIGACPSTKRTSRAYFENVRIYNKALSDEEIIGQLKENPEIGFDNNMVELWFDSSNIIHEKNGNIYHVDIEPEEAVIETNSEKDFRLVSDNENGEITEVKWRLSEDIEGVTLLVDENDRSKAKLLVDGSLEDGKEFNLIAEEVNGNKELMAQAKLVIHKAKEDVNKDLLNEKLNEARDKDPNIYTDETYEVLRKAIEDGNRVYLDKDARKEQVDDAINKLDSAIKGLVEETIEPIKIGWIKKANYWYYYIDNEKVTSGWKWLPMIVENEKLVYNWKYFDKDGRNITQLYHENGMTWLSQAGPVYEYMKGFWTDPSNGQTYYFRETSGTRVEKWQYIDGNWYYFRENTGTLAKGWQWVELFNGEKNWKYFDKDGRSIEKFLHENNMTWLSQAGPYVGYYKGFKTINGNTYFFRLTSGSMCHGFQYINGNWYFFRENSGTLAKGFQYINGNWYFFRENSGTLAKGFQYINGSWYFFRLNSATRVSGNQYINGRWYYFDDVGRLVTGRVR